MVGLVGRLEKAYGGTAKQVGTPIDISFDLNGLCFPARNNISSFLIIKSAVSLPLIDTGSHHASDHKFAHVLSLPPTDVKVHLRVGLVHDRSAQKGSRFTRQNV